MSLVEQICENMEKSQLRAVKELVREALDSGIPADDILNNGLIKGMDKVGEKFKNNEVFVPEVLVAARAMSQSLAILKPLLSEENKAPLGKACIGTVSGDLHDIGKNLVKLMLEGKGIEVIDLGVDVSPEKFIETAINENCNIICCSALLTTTMDSVVEVIKLAESAGIREKVKIMIGGAPITQSFCDAIGADFYTPDAASAATMAAEICSLKN